MQSAECRVIRGEATIGRTLLNDYNKINILYVILSEVELPPSEERGGSASQWAKRDLVTTLGGLLMGCYIDTRSHQNLFRDPFVAVTPRFFLAIRSKKVRLRSG